MACNTIQQQPEPIVTPTEIPTEVPTETPTEVPTEAPTAIPTLVEVFEEEEFPSEFEDECSGFGCPWGAALVGDIITDLFYDCQCKAVKWIKPENLLCFDSFEEAVSRGYKPAQSC